MGRGGGGRVSAAVSVMCTMPTAIFAVPQQENIHVQVSAWQHDRSPLPTFMATIVNVHQDTDKQHHHFLKG